MRVTLLALLCLRAVAEQSGTIRADSAGEAETPLTDSSDSVTGYDSNSVSNEDALINYETTPTASTYPITNTDSTIITRESTMVTSTDVISYTEATITDPTSVTNTDFVTDTDSSSTINTELNSISNNTGVNTNTEETLTTNTDPVTNADSTSDNTDEIANTVLISTTSTYLELASTTEQDAATFNPITLWSHESHFTTLSDLSTESNTDSTEMVFEDLTTIFSNNFSMISTLGTPDPSESSHTVITGQTFTTTAEPITTTSGLPAEGSSTTPTIFSTLGIQPSASSSISTSDTWLSTATLSSASIMTISSTSASSVSVSDITMTGEIAVSSSPRSTMNLSSTTGPVSYSPSVVVTDRLPTTSPSSLSTAITWNVTTPTNIESTSSDIAVPTEAPLSTTTATSTISTAPPNPPKFQDPAIYKRTIETLDSILVGLQNLLNKIRNETQITREKRSISDLDGEERNQIDDEGNKLGSTLLFRVNHNRRLLALVPGTENLIDPNQNSGTSMNPSGESPVISAEGTSLCSYKAPLGDVCHELGTALNATEEVLERTQEKMQQLDATILEQLEESDADLVQLIASNEGNYSNVDGDKATKKIESVMQRASDAKMAAEEIIVNITSSSDDRSWVFVYALAGAVAAVVLLLLGVLVCFCRRRQQSKPASNPVYEEAHGLTQEVDKFHDKLSYENDAMSMTSNRSVSLSSFQDYRRQTSPDQIISKPRAPRKAGQQNPISPYPQTRKDPSRDTIHLEVGNDQSYIHVTAALSSPNSAWRSDNLADARDLCRGYPKLPHGTRVQPWSVSRARREATMYREDGNTHLPHPSRYSAWDEGYCSSTRREYTGRQEQSSAGHMGEYGHEPRSRGLSRPIYLQGPDVVGKIPRVRC